MKLYFTDYAVYLDGHRLFCLNCRTEQPLAPIPHDTWWNTACPQCGQRYLVYVHHAHEPEMTDTERLDLDWGDIDA